MTRYSAMPLLTYLTVLARSRHKFWVRTVAVVLYCLLLRKSLEATQASSIRWTSLSIACPKDGEVRGAAVFAGARTQSAAGGVAARAVGAQTQSIAALMSGSQVLAGALTVARRALEEGVVVHFGLLLSGRGGLLDIGPHIGVGVLPYLSGRL